jgi:hypothetical protein
MRESVWRSPASWLLGALALGACAPRFAVDGRPLPCDLSSQDQCDSTGLCVPKGSASDPAVCSLGYDVRQGGVVVLPVPGTSLADVHVTASDDLVATVVAGQGGNPSAIEVHAAHGTISGERTIVIATPGALRHVVVTVSPIAAAPWGDDDLNPGTDAKPFRTFARAASVAAEADRIVLYNQSPNGGPAELPSAVPIVLPAHITVDGQNAASGTYIQCPVRLMGDANINNVRFTERLAIDVPNTVVELFRFWSAAGISVLPSAVHTTLRIGGDWTNIRNDNGEMSTISVEGDHTSVTLDHISSVTFTAKASGDDAFQAIHFTGAGHELIVLGHNDPDTSDATSKTNIPNTAISNTGGTRAVTMEGGSANVSIDTADIIGLVEILGADSTATIAKGTFSLGQGQGGIVFKGGSMHVADSMFNGNGIVQDSPTSTVVVRRTKFSKYTYMGYQLNAGTLDLGNATELGDNAFTSDRNDVPHGALSPTALIIDAPDGSHVTSRTTTFDALLPPPADRVIGPKALDGVYDIKHSAGIEFY